MQSCIWTSALALWENWVPFSEHADRYNGKNQGKIKSSLNIL